MIKPFFILIFFCIANQNYIIDGDFEEFLVDTPNYSSAWYIKEDL